MTSETETTERDELVRALQEFAAAERKRNRGRSTWESELADKAATFIEHSASREAALCAALKDALDLLENRCIIKNDFHGFEAQKNALKSAIAHTSPAASRLLKIESAAKKLSGTTIPPGWRDDDPCVVLRANGHPTDFIVGDLRALKDALLTGASK